MKTKKMFKWIFLFICLSFTSCDEYRPDLDSKHCVNVNIKGVLHVEPTGEKINDILVEVFFKEKRKDFIYLGKILKVISGNTDENGVFNFNVVIDTMSFNDYDLNVKVPRSNSKYISSVSGGNDEYVNISFRCFDIQALQNIDFAFYNKAILTINLNRTETDNCSGLNVAHSFDGYQYTSNSFTTDSIQNGTSRILQLETAADMDSRIRWIKFMMNGDRYHYADTLICRQNEDNIFNIYY